MAPAPGIPPGGMPPSQFGVPAAPAIPVAQPAPTKKRAVPVVKAKKKRRKKKSGIGMLLFGAFAMLLACVIGGLAVYMVTQQGKLARNSNATNVVQGQQPAVATVNKPMRPKRPLDPVMGKLAGGVEPPSGLPAVPITATGLPANQFSSPEMMPPEISPPEISPPEMMPSEMVPSETMPSDTMIGDDWRYDDWRNGRDGWNGHSRRRQAIDERCHHD